MTKKQQQKRRDELAQMTTRQLVKGPATDMGISGRWDMKKEQLIDAILRAELNWQKPSAKAQSAIDEDKVDEQDGVGVTDKVEKQVADAEADMDQKLAQKMRYVEEIEVGALVAFKVPGGKVKSAKVLRRSSKNRKLKVETDYGAAYVIAYEDVLWVRTGKRWPRWIYNLLKGIADEKGAS